MTIWQTCFNVSRHGHVGAALMTDQSEKDAIRLPIRRWAERHGVSVRTVHRWAESGIVPEPERIRGRNYMPANVEPRTEDKAVA
jgi:hypothetical protein